MNTPPNLVRRLFRWRLRPGPARLVLSAAGLLLAVLLVLGRGLRRSPSTAITGSWTRSPLRDLALIDQEGKPLSSERLRGHATLVNFMFASCGSICPAQARALAQVRQALPAGVRAEVRFLSVSIDPENDTPAVLKGFAEANGAVLEGWWFASAPPDDTSALLQRLVGPDPRAVPGAHPTDLYLVDRSGRLVQRYHGTPPDRDRLVREIQALVALPGT